MTEPLRNGIAIAMPCNRERQCGALLVRSLLALRAALEKEGRPMVFCPVLDGEVSFGRAVTFALARKMLSDDGIIVSVDSDMAFAPHVVLEACALATDTRVVAVPYGKRHGENEWCLALPETPDGSVRMHVRDGGRRTVDVTRAGLGLMAMTAVAYDRVCAHGPDPFWYELERGVCGWAAPVFDPHYGPDAEGRKVRHDDSYSFCVRVLAARLHLECMVDNVGDVVHDGRYRNGEAFDTMLRQRRGYVPTVQ